jgi:hypothetical protein
MKSNVILIAILLFLGVGFNAAAKEDPRNARLAVVPVKGSEVFKVIYKSEEASRIKLNIYDASSRLVFSETIRNVDGFIRPLNFAGLRAGEYTIELINGLDKKVEKITYTPAGSTVSKKNVHVAKLPGLEGKFLVSIADATKENITVRIYDRANNLLYAESREINGDFAQLYRVKDSAGIRIEVSDDAGIAKLSRF